MQDEYPASYFWRRLEGDAIEVCEWSGLERRERAHFSEILQMVISSSRQNLKKNYFGGFFIISGAFQDSKEHYFFDFAYLLLFKGKATPKEGHCVAQTRSA